jgi:hypothetical protein
MSVIQDFIAVLSVLTYQPALPVLIHVEVGHRKGGCFMAEPVARLELHVDAGLGADQEELEQLTLRLLRELTELDIESIELEREGPAPPGARAVDILALGTLVVTLVRSSELLSAVVGVLQSWLAGSRQRSVKLELDGDVLEVVGLSTADQRRLIASWIARHADLDGLEAPSRR